MCQVQSAIGTISLPHIEKCINGLFPSSLGLAFGITFVTPIRRHPTGPQCVGNRLRFGFHFRLIGNHCNQRSLRIRHIQQHPQPFNPRSPADRRRVRAAQGFDQSIIASAAQHGPLRTQSVGHELECRMPIIIEAAHQARCACPGDARSIEPRSHCVEKVPRFVRQERVDVGCAIGGRAIARVLAVKYAQGILVQPLEAVFRKLGAMRFEVRDQFRPPGLARSGIAQCVELKRDTLADPEFLEQLVCEAKQFDVRRRLGCPDHFGVKLVKLAKAPLLRTLVAEQGAVRPDLQRRILLPPLGQIGARNSGCEFGPQGERIAAPVLERVHFLGHHIGRFTERSRKNSRRFENGHFDALESIEPADAIERLHHMMEAVSSLAEHVLCATYGPGCFDFRHCGRSLGEPKQKRYHPVMTAPANRKIGNRFAPVRFIAFLAAFALFGVGIQIELGQWHYAVMGGFDLAAILFFVLLAPTLRDGEASAIRRHAAENDANRGTLLVISALIGAVLLITIGVELTGPGEPMASLIIVTLGLAWVFANMLYALHYAHLFYGQGNTDGGLSFPDTDTPDYLDFVYFAFTLGMTFQTSDVAINSRTIRRVVLAQSLAAFIFNIGILAFTINTLGSR